MIKHTLITILLFTNFFSGIRDYGEEEFIGFALSNAEGTKVIATEKMDDVSDIDVAIFPGGGVVDLQFLRQKKAGKGYRYRQSIHQFEQMPGALFDVESKPIMKPGVCVLASADFLKELDLLKWEDMAYAPLERPWISRIETSADRAVEQSWILAKFNDQSVLAVVLSRKASGGVSAGLVLIQEARIYFYDIPQAAGGNNWRVDDNGQFDGTQFRVLFAYKRNSRVGVAFSWLGFEGDTLSIIETEDGVFREIKKGYHYQAPM